MGKIEELIVNAVDEVFNIRCPKCGAFAFQLWLNSQAGVKCKGRKNNVPCDEFIIARRSNRVTVIKNDCIKNYLKDKICVDDNCFCYFKAGNHKLSKPLEVIHVYKYDVEEARQAEKEGKVKLNLNSNFDEIKW